MNEEPQKNADHRTPAYLILSDHCTKLGRIIADKNDQMERLLRLNQSMPNTIKLMVFAILGLYAVVVYLWRT